MARLRRWTSLIVLMSAWSCWLGEPRLGPEVRVAQLSIAAAPSGPLPVGVADVRSVRIVVRRLDGTVVVDQTSPATPDDAAALERSFSVEFTPPSEVFTVEISLFDATGSVVFVGGPVQVTLGEGAEAGAIEIEPIYVGVGANAESVRIVPAFATMEVGESFTFVAEAIGPSGEVLEGTPARWSSANTAVASLVNAGTGEVRALQPGTVEITARLLTGPTASATLTVTGNEAPVANAGPDQTVTDVDLSGSEMVTLDGSGSSDADGSIVAFEWREGATSLGSGVSITPSLAVGVHAITLTVTDDDGATGTDQVSVTVTQGNQAPVAKAGPDQSVTDVDLSGSETVTLDGSGSSDADGSIVSFQWTSDGILTTVDTIIIQTDTVFVTRIDTIGAALGTGVIIAPSLAVGVHVITLTVTDDDGATGTDQATVNVTPGNRAPVANAGPDQTVTDVDLSGSETVTLDGSGSSDADGSIVAYEWREGATLLGTGVSITPSVAVGAHTITLTVTDDDGSTGTDQVSVTVTQGNQAPVASAGVDQTVTDVDLSGSEAVTLDGSGSSDADGSIVAYEWREGATLLGTGVSITPSLAVGAHTITLTVTDDDGATGTDQVTITVVSAPLLVRSPGSMTFDAVAGGPNPSSQTLQVSNGGAGTLSWSVSDDAPWLSLSPTSGSSTGETDDVTVSVSIAGLQAGQYQATITTTGAPPAAGTPQTTSVTLNLAAPVLVRSPGSMTFDAVAGGSNPASQILQVSNGGAGTLSWSVSDDAPWLSLSPTSGSSTGETDNVTVSVSIAGLQAGQYQATITATGAPPATGTPQTTSVTLNVDQAPSIQLSQSSVSVQAQEETSPGVSAFVNVSNGGGGALTGLAATVVSYSPDGCGNPSLQACWLDASLNQTTATAVLTVTAHPTGSAPIVGPWALAPGVHHATVEISSSVPGVSTAFLQVEFTVTPAPVPGPPVISNFSTQWVSAQCGIANTHSIDYTVSFTDPDGDNGKGVTRVFVQIGAQTPYESEDVYNTYTGTGFSGTVTAHNCLSGAATISIWILDGANNQSNTLIKAVPAPPF